MGPTIRRAPIPLLAFPEFEKNDMRIKFIPLINALITLAHPGKAYLFEIVDF